MQRGVAWVMADDAKALRAEVLDWITPVGLELSPPLNPDVKINQGFHHPATAPHLELIHRAKLEDYLTASTRFTLYKVTAQGATELLEMIQESDPYYVVLGGSMPGIKLSLPQLSNDEATTVIVKVGDLSTAERIQTYQEFFTGGVRQVVKAISAAVDYENTFYPVVEGTLEGNHIRMILSDPQ
ncbi:hypothetical protein DXG01_015341 [Tephrocybe rancida]|nr:hypothetical protein DXG01_015341 [Tephrocybe rancida]